MTGRLELGEKENIVAYNMNKDDPTALYLLASIRRRDGEHEKAEEYIQKALRQDPNDLYVLCEAGEVCLAKGDPAGAKEYFKKVMKFSVITDDEAVRSAYKSGEVPQYACTYSMAEVEVPASFALSGLGRILINEGRIEDAYRLLSQSISFYEYNGDAYFARGLGKLKEGKIDEAEGQFRKGLEVDPYNRPALVELLKIVEEHDGKEAGSALFKKYSKKAPYLENYPEF